MQTTPISTTLVLGFALATAPLRAQETATEFNRWMVFSVNPVGNGDFIGAGHTGSPFTDYEELLFQRCSELGSRSARILASWRDVERTRGQWDWSVLDNAMRLCAKYEIEPVVLICNIPAWVSPTGEATHRHPPKEEYADAFTEFITKMAQRCKGKAKYYEFWNEQNGCSWISDGCRNADMAHTYLPWLKRTYDAIKAVDPGAMVAIGGLDDADGHAPIWLERAYSLRAKDHDNRKMWDAIATHPYVKGEIEAQMKEMADKLDALRKIAARHGDEGIALWITEYGWNGQEHDEHSRAVATKSALRRLLGSDQEDVKIAQQLCVADIEPVHHGFGLCDLNLRPTDAAAEFVRMARAQTTQPIEMGYRIDPDGVLRVFGKLLAGGDPANQPTYLEVIDEEGKVHGRAPIRPMPFDAKFSNLPTDTPLLVTMSSEVNGERDMPVARLPVMLPKTRLANGDFETLFRAGVPWGWRNVGQALVRDPGMVSPHFRHSGKQSLMFILFDNAEVHEFDDRVEVPIPAKRGERFNVRWFARYIGPKEASEAAIVMSAQLIDPESSFPGRVSGRMVNKEWTDISMVVTAPCDAPVLTLHTVSERLGEERWLICIDDVTVTPLK